VSTITIMSFLRPHALADVSPCVRLKRWTAAGYRIEIIYLRVSSPRVALRRIAARVRLGGHNVPRSDVLRRFSRSWINFQKRYRLLAVVWSVYDNSGATPRLLEQGP
jgi:predicted ABC-type ATPase